MKGFTDWYDTKVCCSSHPSDYSCVDVVVTCVRNDLKSFFLCLLPATSSPLRCPLPDDPSPTMPPRGVPSGPRAAGQSSRQSNFRHSARGGIQKRGTTPLRTDRDGDFDMSEAAVGEGRAARSGRGTSIHGAAASQRSGTPEAGSRSRGRPRIGIDAAAVQRAVLREMGADERVTKASTARHSHASNRTQDGLETIRVKGLRQSKAASNRDGGIGDLLAFLERKATHPNEAQVKIKKVCLTSDIAGCQQLRRPGQSSGPLSFHVNPTERRPRYATVASG